MKLNQVLTIIVINLLITCGLILFVTNKIKTQKIYEIAKPSLISFARNYERAGMPDEVVDLSGAAQIALNSVVRIRAKFPSQNDTSRKSGPDSFITDMLGGINPNQLAEERASGSGVIISDDGY